jgi:hypothetical protein
MSRQTNRQWNYSNFARLLSYNNYALIRRGKHMIFSDGCSKIAIPRVRPNQMVIRRLIKEYNLLGL